MSVKLGVIGIGWWGGELTGAAERSGEAEIVTCYARTEDKRNEFAEKHGIRASSSLDELLGDEDVEGVIIATSHGSHEELVTAAAQAGKAVFVDKPLTLDVESGSRAVAAADRAGIVLQVGHQRRRSAANRRIKHMIGAGELGDIQVIETNQSVPNALKMPDTAWRADRSESPLGGMTSLGVHKIDTMHYLVGPMKRVFTFTKNTMATPPIDEATVVNVEFESGALGTLITSFVIPIISRVSVYGNRGTAHNEFDGTKLYTQTVDGGPMRHEIELDPVDTLADQLAEFAKAIRGETEPEVGGREGLAVVAAMEAMVRSAEENRPVDVTY